MTAKIDRLFIRFVLMAVIAEAGCSAQIDETTMRPQSYDGDRMTVVANDKQQVAEDVLPAVRITTTSSPSTVEVNLEYLNSGPVPVEQGAFFSVLTVEVIEAPPYEAHLSVDEIVRNYSRSRIFGINDIFLEILPRIYPSQQLEGKTYRFDRREIVKAGTVFEPESSRISIYPHVLIVTATLSSRSGESVSSSTKLIDLRDHEAAKPG